MSTRSAPPRTAKKAFQAPQVPKGGKGSKGRKKGKGEEKAIPPFRGGALSTLTDNTLLDIFTYLTPAEATKWAQTNQTFAKNFFASKAAEQIWRQMLYSAQVDKFGEYEDEIPANRRAQLEAHFSCRRVISALFSTKCSACDGYAENFCLSSCTRVCRSCWASRGVGEHGLIVQPFSLCAIGYAKTHYLLSDKDIKAGLFCLEVNDATKAHGLMSPKMTIVLESEARKLGEEKFKHRPGGLAAEKTERADKAKAKWEERKIAAAEAGQSAPPEPDSVRKEREKGAPVHYNFVAGNQSFITQRPCVAKEYGIYFSIYTRSPSETLTQPPSVFVTRDTPAEVMAKHPHVTQEHLDTDKCKICTNLVDAIWCCGNGGTLIIDMPCSLPRMAEEASAGARVLLQNTTVGGQPQSDCMHLFRDIKIEGTPRGSITSNRAIFWTLPGSAFALHGVRMYVTRNHVNDYADEYNAPALVLCTHCSITSCRIETEGNSFAILVHTPSATVSDCDIITSRSSLSVHIERIKNVYFSGNRFAAIYMGEDCGFFFQNPSPDQPPWYTREQKLAFQRQLRAVNTCVAMEVHYNGDY